MTNIQAAIGLAQLERIGEMVERRRSHAMAYNRLLGDMPGIQRPAERPWAKNVYWMYSILILDAFGMGRDELMKVLEEKGIESRTFFFPMHEQPVFQEMKIFPDEKYPIAEDLGRRGLYLPSSSGLSDDEIRYVCDTIREAAG
jgi:perosamine synthetase